MPDPVVAKAVVPTHPKIPPLLRTRPIIYHQFRHPIWHSLKEWATSQPPSRGLNDYLLNDNPISSSQLALPVQRAQLMGMIACYALNAVECGLGYISESSSWFSRFQTEPDVPMPDSRGGFSVASTGTPYFINVTLFIMIPNSPNLRSIEAYAGVYLSPISHLSRSGRRG